MSATPEQPKVVQTAMESADTRINRSTQDLSATVKGEIKKLEDGIHGQIATYKQQGTYTDVLDTFQRDYGNGPNTPESLLGDLAKNFDGLKAAESTEATTEITRVAGDTLRKLYDMRKELTGAQGDVEDLAVRVEQEYQTYLPEYRFNPNNVSDSIQAVAERLNIQANTPKIQAAEMENNALLSELRKSTNASKYFTANASFENLCGFKLEDVGAHIAASFTAMEQKAATSSTPNGLFMAAFKAALDLEKTVNHILGNALYGEPDHSSEHTSDGHESNEVSVLTETEMELMLHVLINGVEDKSYWQQLFDAKTAADAYGWNVDTDNEKVALAVFGGIGKAAAGTLDFLGHLPESFTHLVHAAGELLNPHTLAKIRQMSGYAWEHTSPLEKSLLIADISGQILGAVGIGGAVSGVMQSKTMAGITGKISSCLRIGNLTESAMAFALSVNPVLRTMPSLAKWGAKGSEIVGSLAARSKTLAHTWDHLLHYAHTGHLGVDAAEIAQRSTGTVAHGAHEMSTTAVLAANFPTVKEVGIVKADLALAMQNAPKLGITPTEMYELQQSLALLEKTTTAA